MQDPVHVAVGVISDTEGRVLVARRPADVHQGGLWEFPGGKREADETIVEALGRELHEELAIEIDPAACFPVRKIRHDYQDKSVLLDVWRVNSFSGTPRGRESQPLAWKTPNQLNISEFPAANRRIIEILRLPSLLAITPPAPSLNLMLENLNRILDRGVKLIQLRQPGLDRKDLLVWSAAARSRCREHQARLLLNCTPELFPAADADGLHVNAAALAGLVRRPVAASLLFGASCHNLAELRMAEAVDVDYALLSPVRRTSSHPDVRPLGWSGFSRLIRKVSLPVYGLGGLDPTDLSRIRGVGGHGIGAISAFL